MRRRTTALAFACVAIASAAVASACSESSPACRVGADCASGMCAADGTCIRGDAPVVDAASPEGDGTARPDGAATDSDGAVLPGCTPNHDGTITADEVPIAPGLRATFRIAQNEDISTAGTTDPSGKRVWDLSGALASDANELVETLPLAGAWYASSFSGATYATKLTSSSDLLGVFETSGTALLLRGVASPADGLSKTELTESPSVTVLGFPMKEGSSWTSDADVSGTMTGLPSAYHEKYESQVDAAGTLKTPLGVFDVLRVRVLLTRTIGFAVTTTRSFAFVSECYGTVATITSQANELSVEFTQAAEIRRIAP